MAAMSAAGPPIRFLVLVVGVWAVGRSAAMWPGEQARPVRPRNVATRPVLPNVPLRPVTGFGFASLEAAAAAERVTSLGVLSSTTAMVWWSAAPAGPMPLNTLSPAPGVRIGQPVPALARPPAPMIGQAPSGMAGPFPGTVPATLAAPPLRRGFSIDAALALRSGGVARPVEPSLGGSQAYLNARQPVSDRFALTGRLTAALADGRARQAEAALGVGLRPVRSVPVEVVAERRTALSSGGRDAWQLRAVGGGQVERGGWRLEGYGQGGVAGARSRDLFADGEARVSRPLVGPVRVGALVAGAAQPGAARLDVGPQLRVDLPGRTALLASYRVRVAGNAAPGSGPAITLAASF